MNNFGALAREENPEALEAAANRAFAEGDYQHAQELKARAQRARRRRREIEAGVTPGWHLPPDAFRK